MGRPTQNAKSTIEGNSETSHSLEASPLRHRGDIGHCRSMGCRDAHSRRRKRLVEMEQRMMAPALVLNRDDPQHRHGVALVAEARPDQR